MLRSYINTMYSFNLKKLGVEVEEQFPFSVKSKILV